MVAVETLEINVPEKADHEPIVTAEEFELLQSLDPKKAANLGEHAVLRLVEPEPGEIPEVEVIEPKLRPRVASPSIRTSKPRRERSREDSGQDLVRLYLNDIGKYPLLTKEDEVDLAKCRETGKAAAGQLVDLYELRGYRASPRKVEQLEKQIKDGEEARQKFINSNLRLVVSISNKFRSSDLPQLDLIQEGNLGLEHAVDKFDWRRGFKFSTYATHWIKQSIQRGIANSARVIRLPVHIEDDVKRTYKTFGILEGRFGREVSIEEVAAEMCRTPEEVRDIITYSQDASSLDTVISEDGSTTINDTVADVNATEQHRQAENRLTYGDLQATIAKVLGPKIGGMFLDYQLGENGKKLTYQELANNWDMSPEDAGRIIKRAVFMLRHPSAYRLVGSFADNVDLMWQDEARCDGLPTSDFFVTPPKGKKFTPEQQKEFSEVCQVCPVKDECLSLAKQLRAKGVWGGSYIPERPLKPKQNNQSDGVTTRQNG